MKISWDSNGIKIILNHGMPETSLEIGYSSCVIVIYLLHIYIYIYVIYVY